MEKTHDRSLPGGPESRIALFIDYDNLALGLKQSPDKNFNIALVMDRVLEKGRVLVKRAYADWSRYRAGKLELHESAIELIDIPKKRIGGKNSADIRMVVDAMEVSFTKDHLDTFVLVTGDSDFSPLVSKLRESDKRVVGIGIKAASSTLLVDNCDEFIYYDDLLRQEAEVRKAAPVKKRNLPPIKMEAFDILLAAVRGLFRENRDVVWASMVKQTIKRKKPTFDESYHGYKSFSELLLDAEKEGVLKLRKDERSGSLVITEIGQAST